MKRNVTSMTPTNYWGIWDSALCNIRGDRVIGRPGRSTGQVANPGELGQVVSLEPWTAAMALSYCLVHIPFAVGLDRPGLEEFHARKV